MSLNEIFKENWLKILDFNVKISEKKDFDKSLIKVRIPITPLEIDPALLYKLVSYIYPDFVNDKQHVLDIIISNDRKKIEKSYLHLTYKNGNHYQVKKIDRNNESLEDQDFNNLGVIFNKFQNNLREKEGITISGLRIYTEKAIDKINSLTSSINNIDLKTYLNNLCQIFYNLINKNMLYIYPEPSFMTFLKRLVRYLNFIDSSKIFTSIFEVLPEFNSGIILAQENLFLLILIRKLTSNINIKLLDLEGFNYDFNEINKKTFLKKITKKFKLKSSYYFNFQQLLHFLNDLIESDFPLEQGRFSLLLQKLLYAYKSYEINWYSYPRPIIYNFFIKFFSRLVGYNVNLKKLSYWAIPELICNIHNSLWGLSNKLIIIFTNLESSNKGKSNEQVFLKDSISNAYLIEIFNGKLKKISLLDKSDIISDNQLNSLSNIRNILSSKFGYISSVISIDKSLIKSIIQNFLLNLNRFNPFAKLITIRKFQNQNYFNIYPKNTLVQNLKIRNLLPILIDKYEF